jgi:hypothetical protein
MAQNVPFQSDDAGSVLSSKIRNLVHKNALLLAGVDRSMQRDPRKSLGASMDETISVLSWTSTSLTG